MLPSYLAPAFLAYLFLASAGLIDKILLQTTVTSPRAYAFFAGILSVLAFGLLPFGVVSIPSARVILAALASGVAGVYALWAFYSALKEHETSRVLTTVGALVPIFTLVLSTVLLGESLATGHLFGFGLLVLGGALISYRENAKKPYTLAIFTHAAQAAILFAASLTFLRFVFLFQTFWSGLFWSRLGGVLGALSILAVPENFRRIYWAAKRAPKNAPIPYLLNQALGGSGGFLQNYAVYLGSASLVGALQGIEYAFLLVLVLILGRFFPKVRERFSGWEWAQKILAIAIVSLGFYLLAVSQ